MNKYENVQINWGAKFVKKRCKYSIFTFFAKNAPHLSVHFQIVDIRPRPCIGLIMNFFEGGFLRLLAHFYDFRWFSGQFHHFSSKNPKKWDLGA